MTSNCEGSRNVGGTKSSLVPLPARESIMFSNISSNPRRISMGGDDYGPSTVTSNSSNTLQPIHSIPDTPTTNTDSIPTSSSCTLRDNNVRYVSPKTIPGKISSLSANARRISLGSDNGGGDNGRGRTTKRPSRVEDHSTAELVVADPCPIKPLAAYNMFFQMERARLLQALDETRTKGTGIASVPKHEFTEQEIVAYALKQRTTKYEEAKRNIVHKRKHEKSHGKIGFQELARHIANGWKNLTENERTSFNNCYKVEMDHYKNQFIRWYQRHPEHMVTKEQANLLKTNGITIVNTIAYSNKTDDSNSIPTNTKIEASSTEVKCEGERTTKESEMLHGENKSESITKGERNIKSSCNQASTKLLGTFPTPMDNTNEDRNQALRRLLMMQAQATKLQHPFAQPQHEEDEYHDESQENCNWMMDTPLLSSCSFDPNAFMMNTNQDTDDDHLEEELMIEKLKRKKRLLQLRQEVLFHEQELAKQRDILQQLERKQGLLRKSGMQKGDETTRMMTMNTGSNFVSATGLDILEENYSNSMDDNNNSHRHHSMFNTYMNDNLHHEMMDDDEMTKNVHGSCDLAVSTYDNVCYRLNSLHPLSQLVKPETHRRKSISRPNSSTLSSSVSDFPSSAIVTPMTGKPMLSFPTSRSSPINDRQRFIDARQQQQQRLFDNSNVLVGSHRSRALANRFLGFSGDNQSSNKWNIDEKRFRLIQQKFQDAIRSEKQEFDPCDDLSLSGMSGSSLLRTEFQMRAGKCHRDEQDLLEPTELVAQSSTCPTITFDNGDNDDNEPMMFTSPNDRFHFFDPSSYANDNDNDSITTEMVLQTTV